ncbi:MAG: DUF1573 domain-containing protein [Flavobacteriales bacterium]|nr:DUF1573 domain-containing protein [Flavobacteriales bacterium]
MNRLVRYLLLLIGSGTGITLHAQSVEQWTAWGDAAFAKEEYYGASRFYAGALSVAPGRMSLQWKQAEAARLSNQYQLAIDLYARVYQKDAGRTHPEALKWLGEMQLCDGRYADARATWNKVFQKEKDKGSVAAIRARNALAGCELAAVPASDEFEVQHLPAPVNTNDSEFGARVGPDSVLWFTSLRGELNDEGEVQDTAAYRVGIFSSHPTQQGWKEPISESAEPDDMGHASANPMWPANGDRMYFTLIDGDGTKHIAMRTPNGPTHVLSGLDQYPDATQPWVASVQGRSVILFSAQGGEGGMDIWYGDLDDHSVSNIRNTGPRVNSPGNEVSPSFDEASGMLWFSSDFHAGLGGYDIFRIMWEDHQDSLQNVLALNSPANDLYPVHHSPSGVGWLTSNRKGSFASKGETCCNDIYRFRGTAIVLKSDTALVAEVDTVLTAEHAVHLDLMTLQEQFPLKLYFHNDEPEPRTRFTTTRQTYGATYEAYRKLFPTYRSENEDPVAIDAFFETEAEGGRRKLDELIQALIPALDQGERIILDVRGHASPLALNDYNQHLSRRRIESLRNHLYNVENGLLRTYMDSSAANGGVLRLRVLPFGEERAVAGVSDDINDLKRSVYSPEAARERRIEVERIHVEKATIPIAMAMDFDMGTVRRGEPRTFEIPVRNEGSKALRILNGTASCDCVSIEVPNDAIAIGNEGTFILHYTGRTRPGPLERTINLEVEGSATPYVLTIHGNVIE